MHIPDGFVSAPVAAAGWALSAGGLGYAVRRTGRELKEKQVPLMGVLAAFIFAGQMLNFPVMGGTSGHLIGAALATIMLGPWAAMLIMTSVVSIQAILFQDGGLLALGANILNMAVLASLTSHLVYTSLRLLVKRGGWGRWASAFLAGWVSVVVTSILASVELALSGTSPLQVVLPVMVLVHIFIGLGEGLITAAVVAVVENSRRDLLELRTAGGEAR
jgi:cobalt/nickel transport system permease protein